MILKQGDETHTIHDDMHRLNEIIYFIKGQKFCNSFHNPHNNNINLDQIAEDGNIGHKLFHNIPNPPRNRNR